MKGKAEEWPTFFITILLKPSVPGADLKLQLLIDLSSSSTVRACSNMSNSDLVSLEFLTISEEQIASPRKSSTRVSLTKSSSGGAL